MRVDDKEPIKLEEDNRIVRIAYILDSSGSMIGPKYNTAVQSLKSEVSTLLAGEGNYAITLNEFSNDDNFILKNETDKSLINKGLEKIRGIYGGTALYDAIGNTINYLKSVVTGDDVVLVSILTDGEEAHSYRFNRLTINRMIAESGFTFNFIGTEWDADKIVRDLGIKRSNVTTHDNTASGIANSVHLRTTATAKFSKSFYSNNLSTDNFYTND